MLTTIMSAALALLVSAQDDPECADPQFQQAMNRCAAIDFEQADALLNALWPEVVVRARADDAQIDRSYDSRPTSEARLREAQRAWIVFRDAHCAWEGYGEARGGSMEPLIYESCRAALTRERIRQLGGTAPESAE